MALYHMISFTGHGGLSNWTEWSVSDAPCGVSNATRRRYCNNPTPMYRGRDCTGHLIEYKLVELPPCQREYLFIVCNYFLVPPYSHVQG